MVLEYRSAIKKNDIMQLVATRMELEVCAPSEASQKEKDKYDITYPWSLKYNAINLSMKQKQTHRHREQTGGCQGGEVWGGMRQRFGVSRCKQLHVEWIKNQVLL